MQSLRRGLHGLDRVRVDALKRLAAGETVIAPSLATEAALLAAHEMDIGGWAGAHLGLTQREAQLLTLLGQGLSTQQAADEMGLSSETIRTHTRNLYRKLGVSDRATAVAIAWREGLVR